MAAKTEKQVALMKLADDLKISGEHMTSLQTIDSYFEKHRVNEMFNEMLTNILQERPVDARAYILQALKGL